jgi:hypothetical protein
MELRWRPRVTVNVIGATSSGIDLVLKQISLTVAQIRVICKNVPQVSMTNKMTFSQGKMEILFCLIVWEFDCTQVNDQHTKLRRTFVHGFIWILRLGNS